MIASKLLFAVICLFPLKADALQADELRVAGVFTDNAVLQREVRLPVWGTVSGGSSVKVQFAGQVKTVLSDSNGNWHAELMPLEASGVGRSMIVESGEQRIKIRNLLVGEVWYASGQSNMQMTLSACAGKIAAIRDIVETAPESNIRVLRIDEADAAQPLRRRTKLTQWQVDNPVNRSRQSAVAWFFARKIHATLDVPVGIIEGAWGGKPIEGFISESQFEGHASLRPIVSLANQDKLDELAAYEGGVVIRNTAGMPGRIFNARIAPTAPFALRGFIWYQGESNAGNGEDPRNYRFKMQALVDGLRQAWSQPELPVYYVQLPAFSDKAVGWVRLREEQRLSLAIKHTGMAVAIDLRDSDIHPGNKLDVGERLAFSALAKTYGMKIAFSGPLFKSATADGDAMRVEFDHADSGLMVARKEGLAAPKLTANAELAHFELADQTGRWYPAAATIDGNAVWVRSAAVTRPRAVRYACSGDPAGANLYNQAGLPASPFCSELSLLPWPPK